MSEHRDEQWPGRQGGPDGKPTIKQIYAVARALCERCGEGFPETKGAASALIERLRADQPGTKEAA